MDSEQRRVRKLYQQFRRDLTKGEISSDYDENDLIEIYDFASDNGDEYVQLSVLLSAARICPDSEELSQRRGYYFYDRVALGQGAYDMASAHKTESALWAILWELVQLPSAGKDHEAVFDSILDRYSDYDDETIIQLVSACCYNDLYDWLKRRKVDIQKRCLYPDTFLYELSEEAHLRGDDGYAVELLEELTRMVPFNASYWVLLSQCYFDLNDKANALSAVDYALAIDAKSASALNQKMIVLYNMAGKVDEALRIGADVVKDITFDFDLLYQYVFMLSSTGERHKREAAELMSEYIGRFPENKDLIDHLLEIEFEDLNRKALDRYYGYDSSERSWTDWAKEYYDLGSYEVCRDILMSYLTNSGSMPEWTLLLESLYRLGDYAQICSLYDRYIMPDDTAIITMLDRLLLLLAHIRCEKIDAASLLARSILDTDITDIYYYDKRMLYEGIKNTTATIVDKLSASGTDFDIASLDPFVGRLSK